MHIKSQMARLLFGNYKFYQFQVWDTTHTNKEATFKWFIWHKAKTVNECKAYIAPASISKQCVFLAFRTRVMGLKTSSRIACKHGELDSGATFIMQELCRLWTGNYDSLHWNKPSLGRDFLRSSLRKWRYGTSSVALFFELFGLSVMTVCLAKNDGMHLWSNTSSRMTSFCMPWWLGREWLKYAKISAFSAESLFKGFGQTWGARNILL